MINDTVGVVVGRFQIDLIHDGHRALLAQVKANHSRMLILLGVRPAESSDTNPLDFEARKYMLQDEYPDAVILPIRDCRSDELWSKNVDTLIQTACGYNVKATFYVGRNSFAPHYHGKYTIQLVSDERYDSISATDARNNLKDIVLQSASERRGAINVLMNLPHRHTMMVDTAMYKPMVGTNHYELLVGKKAGEDKWRLPGGHVDGEESFRHAGSREHFEETGMTTASGEQDWEIVGDFNVPDWRVRDTDRITYKTVLMVAPFFAGKPAAKSDLVDVRWISKTEFEQEKIDHLIVEEHIHLIEATMDFLERKLADV